MRRSNARAASTTVLAKPTASLRARHNRTLLTQPDSYGNVATPDPGAVGTTPIHQTTFALDNTIAASPTSVFNLKYGLARWHQFRQTLSSISVAWISGFAGEAVPDSGLPSVGVEQYVALGGQSILPHQGGNFVATV